MKKAMIYFLKMSIFIGAFFYFSMAQAGEFTGVGKQALRVLEKHDLKVKRLKEQGMKVLLGEVTGVGKKVDLSRIKFLVSKKDLYKMKDLSHVEYLYPSEAKSLKDVKLLEFDVKTLSPSQVAGMVYR